MLKVKLSKDPQIRRTVGMLLQAQHRGRSWRARGIIRENSIIVSQTLRGNEQTDECGERVARYR